MLHIKRENPFRKKIRNLSFTLFNKLENNNNSDFKTNGEERFVYSLLDTFPNEVLIFDVGANIGGYSEIILKLCHSKNLRYHLHLFEPSKKAFNILETKFLKDKNIYLNNFGASDSDRKTDIYFDEEGSPLTSLYPRKDNSGGLLLDKRNVIQLKRLDIYIREKSLKKIDLLKMDVEGHELFAFEGFGDFLNPSFVKAVQFEYGGTYLDSRTSFKDLYSLFESKGYIIFKIMRNRIEKRKYELKMENFQYSNYVALAEELVSDRA